LSCEDVWLHTTIAKFWNLKSSYNVQSVWLGINLITCGW